MLHSKQMKASPRRLRQATSGSEGQTSGYVSVTVGVHATADHSPRSSAPRFLIEPLLPAKQRLCILENYLKKDHKI